MSVCIYAVVCVAYTTVLVHVQVGTLCQVCFDTSVHTCEFTLCRVCTCTVICAVCSLEGDWGWGASAVCAGHRGLGRF